MNREELERELRASQMAYPLKINRYLKGVAFMPCNDCPFKNEHPPVSIWEKSEDCFQRCPYEILIWILSKEQLELYEKLRPLEEKKKEIDRAINEGKIIQVDATLREGLTPLFYFFKSSRKEFFNL